MSRRSSLLLLIVTVFNLVYNAFLPLHPDEAYYWTWSRHLELSYFDHPPMIAYMIRAATLMGNSEFFIRLVAVVCMTVAGWLIYRLARGLFNECVADIALLILLFMPVTQAGYLVVTPDSPLVLFWSLTVYCLYKALWTDNRSFFYWAGISGGCLLLSKYTGVLLLPAVLLFLLTSRYRTVLLKREVYITVLMAFLLFTPVIVWNAQHEWVSFRFQLVHGMGGEKTLKLANLGDFLAGQGLVMNPIFLLALLYYAIRHAKINFRDERLAFLTWPFVLTFLFFLYGGLSKKSEANWAVPAYLTGAVLLAYWLEKLNRRWVYYAGIALTVVMVVMIKFPEVFPTLPKNLVMKKQFLGYKEIFERGKQYIRDPELVILSDDYQDASEAWYYFGGTREVFILSPGRVTEYDFRRGDLARSPKDAVFFGDEEDAASMGHIYRRIELVDILRYRNRFVEREMRVYRCSTK